MIIRLPNLENRLTINGQVWIAPTAVVIGGVDINTHSSIGHNSVLRGNMNLITIGCLTRIQEDCFVETRISAGVTIGNRVNIGHDVTLTGCVIRDGAIIGNGAIILEGAEIGEDSIIKPGTIIYEGQHIPSQVIVEGSPAKVTRCLTTEEVFRMQKYWQYIENRLATYFDATEKYANLMDPLDILAG